MARPMAMAMAMAKRKPTVNNAESLGNRDYEE